MKTLIAVVNARHRDDWRNAIRTTWMPQVPKDKADIFFFVGEGVDNVTSPDVIELDCSDRYEHLPEKIRAIARWSLGHEYEHMLKCDDDVVLKPSEILNSGYEQWDFSGKSNRGDVPYRVPYGFNYWLSKKSMEIVSKYELPPDGSNDDEKWVSYNLSKNGVVLHDDKRYLLHQGTFSEMDLSRRPLRMTQRPATIGQNYFSRCIHITAEQDQKIKEFHRIFNKYGEPRIHKYADE